VQFPIYDDETAFNDSLGDRLPGVDSQAIAFIRARHRFEDGTTAGGPLHALQALSNVDKHQAIHLMHPGLSGATVDFRCTDCEQTGGLRPLQRPRMEPGAVIAGLQIRFTGSSPKVEMRVTPSGTMGLEDGRKLSALLAAIRDEVRAIVNEPAIARAVA
jgi:hypothetical protein